MISARITGGGDRGFPPPTAVVAPARNTRRRSFGASMSSPTTFFLIRPLVRDDISNYQISRQSLYDVAN